MVRRKRCSPAGPTPILFSLIAACLISLSAAAADIIGKVVAVTDGETIKVLDANKTQHKVRLSGIDAP
jgi:endonuclease YncB( thermonuclease family)